MFIRDIFKSKQKKLADYRILQVEAENLKLKEDLIETLKAQVLDLQIQVKTLRDLLVSKPTPLESASVDAALLSSKIRPRIRTISEAAYKLESLSLRKIGEDKGKSAEELDA